MEVVYWAAGLTAFLYLLAVPVRAGAVWQSGQPLRMGVTVGGLRFTAHGSMKYAGGAGLVASMTHDRSGKTRELSLMRSLADTAALTNAVPSVSRAMKYLFRHVTPVDLRVRAHLSLPDADRTALLYGALNAVLSVLRSLRPGLPLQAAVTADFRSGHTRLYFFGILSCRLGHIMAAALLWLRDYLTGRIHTWITDNRLKAS